MIFCLLTIWAYAANAGNAGAIEVDRDDFLNDWSIKSRLAPSVVKDHILITRSSSIIYGHHDVAISLDRYQLTCKLMSPAVLMNTPLTQNYDFGKQVGDVENISDYKIPRYILPTTLLVFVLISGLSFRLTTIFSMPKGSRSAEN
jgi:hypothetical protein